MAATDFITALARLLRDGALRDAFAADRRAVARQLELQGADQAAFLRLDPADLEHQAKVLLRKRLDLVREIIPETCRRLGPDEWPAFHAYARQAWPPDAAADAQAFCEQLRAAKDSRLSVVEWNRMKFASSTRRIALHRVAAPDAVDGSKRSFQILLRTGRRRWREFQLRLAF